jgi:hypothetical protein
MATVDQEPKLSQRTSDNSFIDEKTTGDDHLPDGGDEREKELALAREGPVGDVFDDVREIDLGADGKERPIGKFVLSFMRSVVFTYPFFL